MAGFIDPISLITLGFLIVGLVVTTSIVKNPESLDIRNWAKVCPDECINDSDCGKNEQCYRPAGGCPVCRARRQQTTAPAAPAQTTTTTQPAPAQPASQPELQTTSEKTTCTPAILNTAGTCPDGKTIRYVRRNTNCITTTDECPDSAAPATAQPTQLVTQTSTSNSSLTPAEIRLEKNLCAAEEGIWKNNRCQYPGTTTPAQPVAPQPATTNTITKSDYQKCLDNGNTPGECSPVAQNIGKPIVPAAAMPPPPATCGAEWEECCGQGYPNGSCNSGLYCSNLDGGTCLTNPPAAPTTSVAPPPPTTPETAAKPQTEQECSSNGLWVSNKCYQEGDSGGDGWIACPPNTGSGLSYWHWFKGETCQISPDAQPQTEQECFSNGLWVSNHCYQEGESGGGGWIACPPETGSGLGYWHWFKGKQCNKISPPSNEAVSCENITPGTTRCNPDETGIQICFGGVWKKSQDCPQDNYCPADSNQCIENCTATQTQSCLQDNQSCLRGNCVNQFTYYSQRDPLWANQPLPGGCSEPTMAGTMGPSICGPTVDAMLLATYVDPSYTPESVVEEFFPNITCYGSALSQHTDLLTSLGFTVTERYLSESSLIQYLENNPNTPFLLHISYTNAYGNVRGHFTLVNGVDADGNLIFQDPYFGENVTAASLPQNFEITDTIRITPPQGG